MARIYEDHKFEALIHRQENQTQLSVTMTHIDLGIVRNYIIAQLVICGWYLSSTTRLSGELILIIAFIDIVISIIVIMILYLNYLRRKEVIGTVENLNEVLGYSVKGAYLSNATINAISSPRPWFTLYLLGIIFILCGVIMILYHNSF